MVARIPSIALLLALAACRTSTSSAPPSTPPVTVSRAQPVSAFELWEDGRLLGFVVRFEDATAPEKAFYSVRNREHQALGLIDLEGRAWRYRPHQREPEWQGTGTVLHGAQRILDGSAAATLIEVELDPRLSAPER
jgi:hypothetical protein